jgi:hypothetical protein
VRRILIWIWCSAARRSARARRR